MLVGILASQQGTCRVKDVDVGLHGRVAGGGNGGWANALQGDSLPPPPGLCIEGFAMPLPLLDVLALAVNGAFIVRVLHLLEAYTSNL